jgi:hypothetical protein
MRQMQVPLDPKSFVDGVGLIGLQYRSRKVSLLLSSCTSPSCDFSSAQTQSQRYRLYDVPVQTGDLMRNVLLAA